MPIVSLPYKPEHLAFCDKPVWVSATDGDTPTLQFPIRMLGIDAPELHYEGAVATTPGKFDAPFNTFLSDAGKDLDAGLKQHLAKKLLNNACTRHIAAGQASVSGSKTACTKGQERQPAHTPVHVRDGRGRSV